MQSTVRGINIIPVNIEFYILDIPIAGDTYEQGSYATR